MLRFPSLTSLTSAGFDQSSLLGDNFASLLDVSVFDSGGNELKTAPVTKRTELTAEFQVWSLTQFYSVHFPQPRIGEKKCVFYKCTIKVCIASVVVDSVLGPPCLERHT